VRKNTKIAAILIIAILILLSAAFIWKNSTTPIIPDGYAELKSPNYGPHDGYPPYNVEPMSSHSGYTRYTPEKLMKVSDLVISGKVVSFSESKWSTPDGQKPEHVVATPEFDENGKFIGIGIRSPDRGEYIYTYMDVQVDTIYKGKFNSEIITLWLPSGTVGEYRMSGGGGGRDVRNYNEGDDILLFLKSDGNKTDDSYYIPTPQCGYVKL